MSLQMSRRQRISKLLLQNPVTVKELRGRMRGGRGFIVLTLYLLFLSGLISLVYLAYASAANQPSGLDPRQAGKPILGTVVMIQVLLVAFIAPAFTMGAISGERERQTYDLLRTTLLSANALVFGKLLSALSFVFLLILAALPVESIAFLLGGVSPAEVIVSQLVILVAAVTYAMIGLFFSAIMRTSLAASVTTFASALFLTFGLPALLLLGFAIVGPLIFSSPGFSWIQETMLIYLGLFLSALNLPATLIVSEILLLDNGTLFFSAQNVSGHTITLISPWLLFLFLYTILTLLLYWSSVRRVQRIPRS